MICMLGLRNYDYDYDYMGSSLISGPFVGVPCVVRHP